jgi:hypothetical protein
MSKQFDLEQNILATWNIIDDLGTLTEHWDTLTEDDKLNILIGISNLYKLKFETTFNSFEEYIRREQNTF